MSKIYLSFLGTNNYLPCTYEYQNQRIENIRFVQEATIRLNCMNWMKDDRVVIFTTKRAFQLNWKDNKEINKKINGKINGENNPEILREGLETRIKKIQGDFSYDQIHIPDGRNEKEIWEIFLSVFEVIHEQDEIIFDITHAFRSIPLLAIVVLNYAKIMKHAALDGIYYGALEALGAIDDVKKMPVERRIVPVLDLSAFDQLMEWSVAADRFLEAGDAARISEIAKRTVSAILSSTKGRDKSQYTIRKLADNLEKFTKILSTCRGREINTVVERLKQNLEECDNLQFNNPLNSPLKTVLGRIKDQIYKFPGHFITDGIQAARWCMEHNLIQQSYTILQETLITYFVYKIGEDPENYQNKNINRILANQAVNIFINNRSKDKWKKEAQENIPVVDKFLKFYETQPELIKIYNNLTGFRNDLNHSGQSDQCKSAHKFSAKMPVFLDKVEEEIQL